MASEVYNLGPWDYVVFSLFLGISVVIGLYHGFAKGGQRSSQQYLLADRNVFSIPVAMTLLASFLSPITLLGDPAETYVNGGLYLAVLFSNLLLYPTIAVVFVPVFYPLGITSVYEYLQLRFGLVIRIFGAIVFFLQTMLYMAIVSYSPALAIETVTDLEVWKTILITGILSTVYTAMGGLAGVIWTDVFMFIVIFGTIITILIMGCMQAGGFVYVWKFNIDEGRMDVFSFPKDLTAPMSFVSCIMGGWINSLAQWAVSQTSVQRFLAAKSLKDAQISVWLNLPFTTFIKFTSCFLGLMIYTFYYGDIMVSPSPATTTITLGDGPVSRVPPNYTSPDQILIYFISQQFGSIPGYQGLFIACLFAGALSTLDSGLNAMTAVTLVDVIKPYRKWRRGRDSKTQEISFSSEDVLGKYKSTAPMDGEWTSSSTQALSSKDIADNQSNKSVADDFDESYDIIIIKVLTVVYGAITIGLAFAATKMGTLVSMAFTIFGAVGSPLVAVFTLGILWKRANHIGTLIGLMVGSALGIWIAVGATVHNDDLENAFGLYRLSVMWYGTFTMLTTIVVAVPCCEIVRLIFPNERNRAVDPMLLASFLRNNSSPIEDLTLTVYNNNHES